jgi:hypothetical protein
MHTSWQQCKLWHEQLAWHGMARHPPCPAAALGPVEVLQRVEAPTLLAEALVHTITQNAADLQAQSTAQHSTE